MAINVAMHHDKCTSVEIKSCSVWGIEYLNPIFKAKTKISIIHADLDSDEELLRPCSKRVVGGVSSKYLRMS